MTKYKNISDDTFRSKLEKTCYTLLCSSNIEFEYEPWEVTLQAPFRSSNDSYERVGKQFKNVTAVRKISYTPDFVGKGWIIETKGKKTPDFQIKWKLFKKYIQDNNLNYTLFMPTNKKQILESINIITNGREDTTDSKWNLRASGRKTSRARKSTTAKDSQGS